MRSAVLPIGYFSIAPRHSNDNYYFKVDEIYPQFSPDFASIVHLGGSVTYIMLQLAYFWGVTLFTW